MGDDSDIPDDWEAELEQDEEEAKKKAKERAEAQRVVEEGEADFIDDLVGNKPLKAVDGGSKTKQSAKASVRRVMAVRDPLDNFDFDTARGMEELSSAIVQRIMNSKAKGPQVLRFVSTLIEGGAPKLDTKDLDTLQRKLKEAAQKRRQEAALTQVTKRKPNDIIARTRDVMDEMDMVYGAGDGDSRDEDEEDDDDGFM